jgi:hypothetical protein
MMKSEFDELTSMENYKKILFIDSMNLDIAI